MNNKLIVLTFSLFFLMVTGLAAQAATLTVTKIADTNDGICDADCSLREAIAVSADGDNVLFSSPLFDTAQTITLSPSFGVLVPERNITITGRAANLTTISAAAQGFRVFVLVGNVNLIGLTITGGRDVGNGSKYGAGIFSVSSATTTVTNCTVSGNTISGTDRALGGGIYIEDGGTLTITGSTISGNIANNTGGSTGDLTWGGGINNGFGSTLNLINSTVSGNQVTATSTNKVVVGGGVFSTTGTLNIINSTITLNAATTFDGIGGGLFVGAIEGSGPGNVRMVNSIVTGNSTGSPFSNPTANVRNDIGYSVFLNNLVSGNSLLGSLANNGGTTFTHAPGAGSPAFNAGNNCVMTANACGYTHPALTNDQRGSGFPRNITNVDIGSIEAVTVVTNSNSSGPGSLSDAIDITAAGGGISFASSFYSSPHSINLIPVGQRLINKDVTIIGPGTGLLEIYSYDFDSDASTRIFYITGGATLNLSGVTLNFAQVSTNGENGGAININNGTLNADKILLVNGSAMYGGGIYNNGTLNLSNSTIYACGARDGGGIYNETGRTATVTNSTIQNNFSSMLGGGGIHNKGTLMVTGSTILNNSAYNSAVGAGIYAGPVTTINNSTISGNTCVNTGGGCGAYISAGNNLNITNTTVTNNLSNDNLTGGVINLGTFAARNSIIAGNRNANGTGTQEVSGVITGGGYNLLGSTTGNSYIGDTTGNLVGAANLAPIGNYGGTTATHALLSNSPAIDAGDVTNPFALDQRGSTRPIGGLGDIGSFERNIAVDQATLTNANQSVAYSQSLTVTRSTGDSPDINSETKKKSRTNILAPFTFSVVPISGQGLPPGLTLSPAGILSGTPTTIGLYTFTIKATDTDGMAGVQQYSMYVFAPSAATVSVSGRLLTASGQGLRGAVVILAGSGGVPRTARSTSFGYFRFDDVATGETYTVSVQSKGFDFGTRVLTVNDAVENLDLIAEP